MDTFAGDRGGWNGTRTGARSGTPEMEVLKSWGVTPKSFKLFDQILDILVSFKLWIWGSTIISEPLQ